MNRPGEAEHIDQGDGSEYYSESPESPPPGRPGAAQGIGESVRQSRASSTRAARAQQAHQPPPRTPSAADHSGPWPEQTPVRHHDPIMRDPSTNEEIFDHHGHGQPFLDTHTGDVQRPPMTPHPTVHTVTEHHDRQRSSRPHAAPSSTQSEPAPTPDGGHMGPESRRMNPDRSPRSAEFADDYPDDPRLDSQGYRSAPSPEDRPAPQHYGHARMSDPGRQNTGRSQREFYDFDQASQSSERQVYDVRDETHSYDTPPARSHDRYTPSESPDDRHIPRQDRTARRTSADRMPDAEHHNPSSRGRFYDSYDDAPEASIDRGRAERAAERPAEHRTPAYAGAAPVASETDHYHEQRPAREASTARGSYRDPVEAEPHYDDGRYEPYPDEPLADVDVDVPLDRDPAPESGHVPEEGRLSKKSSKFPRPRLKARTSDHIEDDYPEPVDTAQQAEESVPEPVDPLVRVAELKLQDRQNLATQAIYRLIIAGTVAICAMLIGLFLVMTKLMIPGIVFAVIGGAVFLWELSSHGRIRARRKARSEADD